jgi:hypothetical protein
MNGCDYNKGRTKYIQLTSDDLAHLYINLDTLYYDGNEIEYKDSILFLLNSVDTITVGVRTQIWSTLSQFAILDVRDITGKSTINFNKTPRFYFADIEIFRDDYTYPSRKIFTASKGDGGRNLDEWVREINTLDTACILGRQYEDVYKFLPPSENHESGIKTVYFAKKYGFIMIEGYDGSKVELIEIKSKGVKE